MNRASFLDELLKIADETNLTEIPHGLIGSEPAPPSEPHRPAEAASRVPLTATLPSVVGKGELGGVTQAKDPIDRFKYNRVYRERR